MSLIDAMRRANIVQRNTCYGKKLAECVLPDFFMDVLKKYLSDADYGEFISKFQFDFKLPTVKNVELKDVISYGFPLNAKWKKLDEGWRKFVQEKYTWDEDDTQLG
jgi:hypothetical protein